jgi:hypothetical protein
MSKHIPQTKLFQGGTMQRPQPHSFADEHEKKCVKCNRVISDEWWWYVESDFFASAGERFHYHIDCATEILFKVAKQRDNERLVTGGKK